MNVAKCYIYHTLGVGVLGIQHMVCMYVPRYTDILCIVPANVYTEHYNGSACVW